MKKLWVILLSAALMIVIIATISAATSVKVQFFNGSTAASTNTIATNFKLVNTGTDTVTLANVKLRYYFTNDGTPTNSFACDWCSASNVTVSGNFVTINSVTNADRYLEVGFTGAGTLAAGASVEVKGRIWKSDWSNFTQTNDYSFNATATNYVDSITITAYINGNLYWGTPPGGGVITATPTPTRSTIATPTSRQTPTPTTTVTPTQRITPTPTATPTPTRGTTLTPTSTPTPGAVVTPKSVLYAMNYLSPETTTDNTLNDIKNSGFDTLIIFSIDGNASGDLTFFGTPIYTNGVYVGPAGWPARIKSLKTGTTSIKRLQFCLAGPYGTYRTYMNTYGTGSNTNWYRNWAKVKEDMGVDAIDFNDENTWDANSLVQLGNMMAAIGYKVTLCPYNNPSVWQNVKSQLGSKVDAVNLQCYDGGRNNNVGTWNTYFGGLKVTPLFWTLHADGTGDTYSSAQTKVSGWKTSYGIISAGAWQYSDMRDYSGGNAAQYNAAIRAGLQ